MASGPEIQVRRQADGAVRYDVPAVLLCDGIHVQYHELIQTFIKFDSIIKIKIEKNIFKPKFTNDCFNFEKIDSIPKLYFPFIYSKLIEKIDDKEIYEFNKNILKYDDEKISIDIFK